MKHTKECRNLKYKTLVFDEFFASTDIDTCAFADICPVCASEHNIDETLLTPTDGGCTCGVKGCMNDAEYTIQFPKNSEEYIFGGNVKPEDIDFNYNREITLNFLYARQATGMYKHSPEHEMAFDKLSDEKLEYYFHEWITQEEKIEIYNEHATR